MTLTAISFSDVEAGGGGNGGGESEGGVGSVLQAFNSRIADKTSPRPTKSIRIMCLPLMWLRQVRYLSTGLNA
ncbi:hypothetical protein B9Y66_08760 [Stenotrophomonas maltophilia]|nr:hypothetical protein B9Y66_08760 [Stenotrophomonas maltophilia]